MPNTTWGNWCGHVLSNVVNWTFSGSRNMCRCMTKWWAWIVKMPSYIPSIFIFLGTSRHNWMGQLSFNIPWKSHRLRYHRRMDFAHWRSHTNRKFYCKRDFSDIINWIAKSPKCSFGMHSSRKKGEFLWPVTTEMIKELIWRRNERKVFCYTKWNRDSGFLEL